MAREMIQDLYETSVREAEKPGNVFAVVFTKLVPEFDRAIRQELRSHPNRMRIVGELICELDELQRQRYAETSPDDRSKLYFGYANARSTISVVVTGGYSRPAL